MHSIIATCLGSLFLLALSGKKPVSPTLQKKSKILIIYCRGLNIHQAPNKFSVHLGAQKRLALHKKGWMLTEQKTYP